MNLYASIANVTRNGSSFVGLRLHTNITELLEINVKSIKYLNGLIFYESSFFWLAELTIISLLMSSAQPSIGICICTIYHWLSGKVFTTGSGDWGSISRRVIPKTQKMVLNTSLLNTQHYKVCFKGKMDYSRKGVAHFATSRCSGYWKGSLRGHLWWCNG